MKDYDIPRVPEIESAYRAALQALDGIAPRGYEQGNGDNLIVTELISALRYAVDAAEMTAAAELGPVISWEGPRGEQWELIVSGMSFEDDISFGDHKLGRSAWEGDGGEWLGSSMSDAARAYRRECGWDFAPGDAGVWLVMLAPVSAWGGGDADVPWHWRGHLVGFVILHDRDEDGAYESVAHIWTAAAWRRQGIARRLLAEARRRFSYTAAESPYTPAGHALLRSLDSALG